MNQLNAYWDFRSLLGYPGLSDGEKNYLPPHHFGTQWKVDNVNPTRLEQGRYLLHTNTTSNGISGSPLYRLQPGMKNALVIGVHVGASRVMGNAAIPISYHFEPAESSFSGIYAPKATGKNLHLNNNIIFKNRFFITGSILFDKQTYIL